MRGKGPVSGVIGRVINSLSARSFDAITLFLIFYKRIHMSTDLARVAQGLAKASTEPEVVEKLCRYVFENISYARSARWLGPADTLRLGYGDCKCHAVLLNQLLSAVGIETRLVVGATGYRKGFSRAHAWVECDQDGETLVCDASLYPEPIVREEYIRLVGGALDVTREYALKRPDLTFPGNSSRDKRKRARR